MYSRLRYNDDNDCDVRVKRNFVCVDVCVCIYVCVGFQESSLLIICARTAEDCNDDEEDKRMTTAIATSSSFSLCRLSLSLLMLCHPRLDQRTDRQKRKEKTLKNRIQLSILLKHAPHAYAYACTNDAVPPILLHFYACFTTTTIIWPDLYKHDEKETMYRLVGGYIR
jgi:hypothetical protein